LLFLSKEFGMAKKKREYPLVPIQKVVLVKDKSVECPITINNAFTASVLAKVLTEGSPDESLIVICLDNQHKVLFAQVIATGAPDNVAFTPAQVFRAAIVSNAAGIIVAHNHPSGKLELSSIDRSTFEAIQAAGKVLGIGVLDFLVVTDAPGYASAWTGVEHE
jgi:DNA repair protein RadC